MKAVYLEQQHLAQMACFCVLLSVSRSERLFFLLKEILIYKEFERKNDIGQSKGYLKICNDIPVHVLKISYVFCNLVILQNWQQNEMAIANFLLSIYIVFNCQKIYKFLNSMRAATCNFTWIIIPWV